MPELIKSLLHKKFDVGVKDKKGWGYRCKKCEQKTGHVVWHKLPF